MAISGKPRDLQFGRLLWGLAIWVVFILAAHELAHRILPVTRPVPGPGLAILGQQAVVITIATLGLLVARQSTRVITLRIVLATAIWVSLIVLGHYLTHLDPASIRDTLARLHESMGMGALLTSALTLAILLGLPFVPSVEMGLMMMLVFGRDGAVAAWLATIGGLSLSHAAGRYMPAQHVRWLLEQYALLPNDRRPVSSPVGDLAERLNEARRKGYRIGAFMMRHRYLLLALLINMPGNSVIGGGGGIALVSGFSRLYRWIPFVVTVALASLPIPLLVFFGLVSVDRWLAALGGP
jgi:hypothetical protein